MAQTTEQTPAGGEGASVTVGTGYQWMTPDFVYVDEGTFGAGGASTVHPVLIICG